MVASGDAAAAMVFLLLSSAHMVPVESGRYGYDALSQPSRNGDPMDTAGLSHERGARSGAARRSNSARDQRARRPSTTSVHREPVHLGQVTAWGAERAAGDVEPLAAVRETADHLQADYFLRLLTQSRRLVDHRIDEYAEAIAAADTSGDVEAARNLRRMASAEEQERRVLDDMIEKLRRRFPGRTPGEVPTVAPRARFAVR